VRVGRFSQLPAPRFNSSSCLLVTLPRLNSLVFAVFVFSERTRQEIVV
jgi:hypothetical protein